MSLFGVVQSIKFLLH